MSKPNVSVRCANDLRAMLTTVRVGAHKARRNFIKGLSLLRLQLSCFNQKVVAGAVSSTLVNANIGFQQGGKK